MKDENQNIAFLNDVKMPENLEEERKIYNNGGVTLINNLISPTIMKKINDEVFRLFNAFQRRYDLKLKETSNTPRKMSNVNQPTIKEKSQFIPELYQSDAIKGIIKNISGEDVFDLPWEQEQYIITSISEVSDTHGWHWDDYRFAVVFIIKAPKIESGGLVQCVPNTVCNNEAGGINKVLCSNPIYSYCLHDGDVYLLKSDTTLHRVAPLDEKDFRLALVFTYACKEDLEKNIDHSLMYKLYSLKEEK